MPFKSKAQRRRFAQLLVEGEITPEVYEEWNRETGTAQLPERVKKKKARQKPTTRRKRKSRASSPRATRATTRRRATRKKRAPTRKRTPKRSGR